MEKFELFLKYQQTIHGDKEKHPMSFKRFLCDSPLFVRFPMIVAQFICPAITIERRNPVHKGTTSSSTK
jgi:arginyl-tRNA--protein-N-Asp/Glu arginylyltransferase